MGKTVESYRMALEDEISRWGGFEKAFCYLCKRRLAG
jgi:hypothetical protein